MLDPSFLVSMTYPLDLPPFSLLSTADCPAQLPQPKYRLGESVQWTQVPNPDFGRIIGVVYTQEASCQITGLHYLILLSENSPSHSICTHDFAVEDDIEPLKTGGSHAL